MSLLLDVVLFIRNNASVLKLSALERLVLITLAGRIGQNETTWVKQETLANECLITDRYLRMITTSLKKKKLVDVQKNGRSLSYSLLLEKRNCSSGIDEHKAEEKRNYSSGISLESGTTVPVYSGTTVPVLNDEEYPQSHVAVGLPDIPLSPKVKDENKHIIKRKEKRVVDNSKIDELLPDWLAQEDWEEYVQFRKEMRKPLGTIGKKRAISALTKFHNEGQDISKIIDQSIVNGWQGLFPFKGANNYADSRSFNKLTPHQASIKRGWDVIRNW